MNRIVVKGASLEILAAKKEAQERITSDTESKDHIAHRLALRGATSILPKSWRRKLLQGFLLIVE